MQIIPQITLLVYKRIMPISICVPPIMWPFCFHFPPRDTIQSKNNESTSKNTVNYKSLSLSLSLSGWVVASVNLLEKSLKMSKNIFLIQSFYKLRNKHHTSSSLRSWPWKGQLNRCLRFKKVPHIDFLELHVKQAKRSKRHIKTKFCVPVDCKIWRNSLVDVTGMTK